MTDLLVFIRMVGNHWSPLVTGGGIVAMIVILERYAGRQISWRVVRWLVVVSVVVAIFMTWRDEHTELTQLKSRQKEPAPTATPIAPVVITNTAEEDRLRGDVKELQAQLDERKRHREDRRRVAEFLAAGNAIMAACDTLQERPDLDTAAGNWATQTLAGLTTMDPSYAARFQSASGGTYVRSIGNQTLPEINNRVWNWVRFRTEALNRILESMPN
jgi:hypothetical protein